MNTTASAANHESREAFLRARAEEWSEDIGLWRNKSKHGRIKHDIRANATKLVLAANLDVLDQVPTERVLSRIRQAQATRGNLRGNFWWSWEDGRVTDRNSGFFTTIQLLALHFAYRDRLSEQARKDLDHMLTEAQHWFRNRVYPITDKKLRYPNAYFGDFVCLWLIRETSGRIDETIQADLGRVVTYYLEQEWGWGEHLSDVYSKILQNELLAMLTWGRSVSAGNRDALMEMLTELTRIDALFAGGPRVPAMRNKSMLSRSVVGEAYEERHDKPNPHFRPYNEQLRADSAGGFTIATLAARSRPELVKSLMLPRNAQRKVDIACHGGIRAVAWVDERWRIGVMSYYPIFADMLGHPGHGLGIQDIPVAFWHARGDWAYLQWAAYEEGKVHALPAKDNSTAMLQELCRLSDLDPEACLAETMGIRDENQFLVLRRIPHVAKSWQWVADRLRLIEGSETREQSDEVGSWHRLLLHYPEEVLTVAFRPVGEAVPALIREGEGRERFWGARWHLADGNRPTELLGLWFFAVGPAPAAPPPLRPRDGAIEVALSSGRRYRLDVGAEQPWQRMDVAGSAEDAPHPR